MKKRLLIPVMLAVVLIFGPGGYALASGWTKVFHHTFTITVEPIEVQVERVSSLLVHADQPVEVAYKITNHSTQTHWNLTAELWISPGAPSGIGVQHDWTLRGQPYTPGTLFQIPSGTTVEMKVRIIYASDLDYAGDIPIEIKIYRVSGEPGKG